MSAAFQQELDRCSDRMQNFLCTCDAIAEPHRVKHCSPMFHRMTWHGETILKVTTVAEAIEKYPHDCEHYPK